MVLLQSYISNYLLYWSMIKFHGCHYFSSGGSSEKWYPEIYNFCNFIRVCLNQKNTSDLVIALFLDHKWCIYIFRTKMLISKCDTWSSLNEVKKYLSGVTSVYNWVSDENIFWWSGFFVWLTFIVKNWYKKIPKIYFSIFASFPTQMTIPPWTRFLLIILPFLFIHWIHIRSEFLSRIGVSRSGLEWWCGGIWGIWVEIKGRA